MRHRELSDTLAAVVEAVLPPAGSGLVTTEAEIEMPLEVFPRRHGDRLVIHAAPPYSRWVSGVLPAVHRVRLRAAPVTAGDVPIPAEEGRSGR